MLKGYEQCRHVAYYKNCINSECELEPDRCCFTCPRQSTCEDVCPGPDIKEDDQPNTSGAAIDQKHYQVCDPQPIEIMQMYMTPEEFKGFLKGCVIKYSLRAKFKGDEQKDIDKAYQYTKWLGQALRGEKINPREAAAS